MINEQGDQCVEQTNASIPISIVGGTTVLGALSFAGFKVFRRRQRRKEEEEEVVVESAGEIREEVVAGNAGEIRNSEVIVK